MACPSLMVPRRPPPAGAAVSAESWLRAARTTDEWLWQQAQSNRAPAPVTPAVMPTPSADAETPHHVVPLPAHTVPKAAPTAAYVRRALAPPRVRVLSFLQQRRG